MNASGTTLASKAGGVAAVAYKAPTAGTLYVEVRSYSNYVGSYSFKLEDVGLDDHGDAVTNATAITPGGPGATGNIESDGDVDVFSFNAVAGRIYRFTCSPSTTLSYCSARLLGAGSAQLVTAQGTPAVLAYKAPTSGTLYAEVRAYSTGYLGTYTWALEDLGVDDVGDTPGTATAISLGAPISAKHETALDEDWFSVTLNAGQSYQVLSSTTYLGLTVFASNGVTQLATASYPPLAFSTSTAGTYYVRVKPYSFNGATANSYTFTVQ
jgi:hypothetical protein